MPNDTQTMQDSSSLANWFRNLPTEEKVQRIELLSPEQQVQLLYDWRFWARNKQLPPKGVWDIWALLTGRGFGKTRTGAEYIRGVAEGGFAYPIHLIGPTASDVRDVMIEGPAGLLEISPPWFRPEYKPSKRKLIWPNGVEALLFSAEEPERLRGPQCGLLWADEFAAWRYPDTWDMAMFGLRLGSHPKAVVTSTPRPVKHVKELVDQSKEEGGHNVGRIRIAGGSSHENRHNVAEVWFSNIINKYEGTRLGRQEIEGELLEDFPGALWTWALIDDNRKPVSKVPPMKRIVVSVDPAVTSTLESDETGITVVGLGEDDHGYVFADGSGIFKPIGWARKAVRLYEEFRSDCIIGEANNGGDLVESNLRSVGKHMAYKKVWASRGKRARAEPVSTLYERGMVHHVGSFKHLEDEMCTWDATDGSPSPSRVDSLVWGLTELMLKNQYKTKATSRQG